MIILEENFKWHLEAFATLQVLNEHKEGIKMYLYLINKLCSED